MKQTIRIGGMTCINCQNLIERKLRSTAGVEAAVVSFNNGTADLVWDPSIVSLDEIKAAVENLNYQILDGKDKPPFIKIAGTLFIILALYVLLRRLGITTITQVFPLAEAGMSYGMVFVIGLITSVHCAAMCGGINLSQTLQRDRGGRTPLASTALRAFSAAPPAGDTPATPPSLAAAPFSFDLLGPSILYNTGRVVSYTAVGMIAGALGSVVFVSGKFQGIVQLIAGVFMIIMGITMLGFFPQLRRFNLRIPNIFNKPKSNGKNPLVIGLLNGLMPCGPLQAMQIYALSTGSPISGGLSMFLFGMGTVPLMFGIGALSSLLSTKFTHNVMKAGAALVTVMGMIMFTYGWNLSVLNLDFVKKAIAAINPFTLQSAADRTEAFTPIIENGVQLVNSTLNAGRYPAITVRQGIPVRWTINAPDGSINGCNNRMIIREYGIEHRFTPGENVITFTPERTGKIPYSCWMGMIRSSITVVGTDQSTADTGDPNLAPVPAGVVIPTDKVLLAEKIRNMQTVTINLQDGGIDPALIIVQRNIPVLWTINNNSLDPGNSRLVFPAYYTYIDIKQGDNIIQLLPLGDFDFSTADNVFYGFVKVVDDLEAADIEAIKKEVAQFETQIYPKAYFESAVSSSCCIP